MHQYDINCSYNLPEPSSPIPVKLIRRLSPIFSIANNSWVGDGQMRLLSAYDTLESAAKSDIVLKDLKRGSGWGYLDNTKHLSFCLNHIKQLNFRLFNI